MYDSVTVVPFNETYIRLECEAGIAYELSEYFTFFVPGYQHHPKFKARMWDGRIRLFSLSNRRIYKGLIDRVKQFCHDRNYEFNYPAELADEDVSFNAVERFLKDLNLPSDRWPREYQIKAFVRGLRKRSRLLLLSPTASGKSLIIYLFCRWHEEDGKTLIIVPTKGLVNQMSGDFDDYGYEDETHNIMGGVEKDSKQNITISTWQSIYKQPTEWFEQFNLIIGDEVHGFKAKSLMDIMTKAGTVKHRIGTTGTLDDVETNQLTLEGLFGPVYNVTTTKKLMEQGHVAKLAIKCIVLKYPAERCKDMKGTGYAEEVKWLTECDARNKFIANLASSLDGNTISLFRFKDHGKLLHEMIGERTEDDRFFIDGGVDAADREEIRKIVDKHTKAKLTASVGTTSTGTNIQNLNNMLFVHPSKSKIRVLQSVGRGLRKSEIKNDATLYDIADDLQWKSVKNHTLKHFEERVKMYAAEGFDFKIYVVELKNG